MTTIGIATRLTDPCRDNLRAGDAVRGKLFHENPNEIAFMSKMTALAAPHSILLLLILASATTLSSCDKQPSSASAPPTSTSSTLPAGANQGAKEREDELARREAAVAEKERALQLSQREADVAAAEQELARKKEAESAAARTAARKAAAKAAAAKAAAARAVTNSASSAQPPGSGYPRTPAAPVARSVQVPGGTPIVVALSSALSSKTAKTGDTFEATVASNVVAEGRVAVPAGTRVTGKIVQVTSGSRAIGAVPVLGLEFDRLELGDGQIVPISGTLNEQGASEKVQDSAKIVGGAAAGAVLGHQVHTNSGGTIVGGLLGGAIGALVARNTGSEVQLAAGSQLTLNTADPFTVMVRPD
jgi:type IV secretory pathway VirB10-like protein